MITTLTIIESAIFFILAGIHFNWVIGGEWGFNEALPTNSEGKRVLNPRKIDSFIVSLGLLSFGFFFLIKASLISIELPDWLQNYGGWGIAAIFLLRAIGDFKYIGFFKKVKTTDFAITDSKYFSPLCFLLGVIAIIISIL